MTDLTDAFDRIEKLLDFPTDFPIKVMGNSDDGFVDAIGSLVLEHVPNFDVAQIQAKQSRRGTFTSLTVTVNVHSRDQLQRLYQALADHHMVRIVI